MDHPEAFVRVALPVALAATAVRYTLNRYIAGCRLGVKASPDNKAAVLLEEVWLLVCSTLLLCLSTWASEGGYNARCSLLDQSECFDKWPAQHNSPQMVVVSAIFVGWYIHGVAKSLIPGVALRSGVDMMGHHVLTIALFVMAHKFHCQRMGFQILALLNFSNPFMHIAKILNHLGQPASVKTPAFVIFGISFAISRCMLFPKLLKASADAVVEHLRDGDYRVVKPAVVSLLGLGALQLLQFYWMHRIIRVLVRGGDKPSKAGKAKQQEQPRSDDDGARAHTGLAVNTAHHAPGSSLGASDASTGTSCPNGGASEDEGQPGSGGSGGSGDKAAPGVSPLRRRVFFDSASGEDARSGKDRVMQWQQEQQQHQHASAF